MIFLKKYTEIWYFLQAFWKYGLSKRCRAGTWSFLYYLERWYFFPENMIFFPWAESERWPFSGNTWKYDISVYTHGRYKRGTTPLCQKNQRWSYPAKIHLKVIDVLDWHPRKSSSNSLYFHGDLYRRFHILLSSKKKQETKYIYSVGGILQWIIFNTLYHSTLRSCIWRFAWAPFKEIICPLGDWL